MFVELIESLRCPNRHEESALIASVSTSENRHIQQGALGCPVCRAEFLIRDGVAWFGETPPPMTAVETPSQEIAMRLAAFLDLTDSRGFALLCGRWAAHAELVALLAATPLVLVNHPSATPVRHAAGAIRGRVIPFAAGSARALAIDETTPREIAESGVRAVRPGGRVLGPAMIPLPAGVTEITRDERMWVGEKSAVPDAGQPRLVKLERGNPTVS
jgi:uncharacterized protein YbaR (Trm112 family)